MKLYKQFQDKRTASKPEINSGEQMTKPEQHLSIRQLLYNHSRGIPSDTKHYEAQYFEGELIPKIHDLTDLDEYKRQLAERKTSLEDNLSANQAYNERVLQYNENIAKTPLKTINKAQNETNQSSDT